MNQSLRKSQKISKCHEISQKISKYLDKSRNILKNLDATNGSEREILTWAPQIAPKISKYLEISWKISKQEKTCQNVLWYADVHTWQRETHCWFCIKPYFSKKLKMISNAMIELVLCQTPKETPEKQKNSKNKTNFETKRKTETICKKVGNMKNKYEKINCQHAKRIRKHKISDDTCNPCLI